MALFRALSAPEPLPPITGEGIVLRGPQMTDFAAWAELREASRKFLTPWEPIWPVDDLTKTHSDMLAASGCSKDRAGFIR